MNPEALIAHDDFVRALARHLVHDRDRADDVAQESWLHALTRRTPGVGAARAWLAQIVRNASRDDHRTASRRERHERTGARRETVPSTAEIVEREALRREVVEAVLRLDEPFRDVILLRFYELLPPREIASRLGLPVETVRTRIKRGLERLRAGLGLERDPARRQMLSAIALGGITVKTSSKAALAAIALLLLGVAVSPFVLDWLDAPSRSRSEARASRANEAARAAPSDAAPPESNEAAIAAAAPEEPAIAGQVVDEAGTPVAGATVVAGPTQELLLRLRADDRPPDRGVSDMSGADGRFRIPVTIPPVTRRLCANAPGFAPSVLDAVCGEPARIVLERGRSLTGTVRDAEEKPIAGARVQVLGLLGSSRAEREALSAADGTYRVDGIASEAARGGEWRTWCIVATAAGFAPHYTPADEILRSTRARDVRYDPYLVRGATVTGRVVDAETRSPVPDASLFLLSTEAPESSLDDFEGRNPYCPRLLARSRAGADGAFKFVNVPAEGPLPITSNSGCAEGPIAGIVGAIAPGYCQGQAFVVVARDGASLDLTIELWPAATVAGRVVDEEGRPVEGAGVWSSSEQRRVGMLPRICEGAERLGATTDAAGRYILRVVPAPRGSAAQASIGAGRRSPPFGQTKATVSVRAGETTTAADLVLPREPHAVVVVAVSDPQGRPVPGATLRHGPNDPVRGGTGVTDDRGRASLAFDGKPAYRRDYRVFVSAPGFAPALSPPFVPVARDTVTVGVVLDPGHRLTGRAMWTNGKPAAGVSVYAVPADAVPEEVVPSLFGKSHGTRTLAPYVGTRTGSDGSFELRVPARAPQRLLGSERAGGPATLVVAADAKDVEFVVGEEPAAGDEGGIVEGTVVEGPSKTPVLRFEAKLAAGEKLLGARRVGPGRFRCTRVPAGAWKLKTIAEGSPPVEQDVVVEAGKTTSVVVQVAGGVTLRGRVVAPADIRVENGMVLFTRAGTQDQIIGRVRKDGTYEATGLASGTYSVGFLEWDPMDKVDHACVPEEAEIRLVAEKEQTRDVRVLKGGVLAVHVRSGKIVTLLVQRDTRALTPAELEFLESVTLEVRDAEGRLVRSSKFMHEQSWTLPYGSYEVRIAAPEGAPHNERVILDSKRAYATFDLE